MVWGLVMVIIKPAKLEEMIQGLYVKIPPLLKVNRNIAKEYRMPLTRYHGLEMPNFVVHCFVTKVFLLQCFWGFEGVVGAMMRQAC